MTERITTFGVHHAEGGVWFLEQNTSSNALGIRLQSPFHHVRPNKCNHRMSVISSEEEFSLPDNLLLREMLPTPKDQDGAIPFFVNSPSLMTDVGKLSRLTSPVSVSEVVRPIWAKNLTQSLKDLETSNVQPLVLVGVGVQHIDQLRRLCEAAIYLPRKLIFVGGQDVIPYPPIVKIPTTGAPLPNYNWADFGNWYLSKWMRGDFNVKTVPNTRRGLRHQTQAFS